MNWLKRILTPPLIVLAAVLMWIEESLWEFLKVLTGWVAKFPLIRWYEGFLRTLPPYPTMVVFLIPGACLFPVKLAALVLMKRGMWFTGLSVIIAAKVLGTAIVARSYVVCQPKLMTIGWFARLHDWLIATRDELYGRIKAMPLYQAMRVRLSHLKQLIRQTLLPVREFFSRLRGRGRGLLMARWLAIRRWLGRRRA